MNHDDLQEILKKHELWLSNDEGGERAYLRGVDLRRAYLGGADLRGAYLGGAYLRGVDLGGADLRGVDLRGADLRGAYLGGADLREIKSFWGCCGNKSEIKSVHCDIWDVTYTDSRLQIGCQLHDISEWWEFSDDEISDMDSQALEWWKIWKPILQTIIEKSPATPGRNKE